MNARFARGKRTATGGDRTVFDVSEIETTRVCESVGEWFPDVTDVHLERKGGTTLLVVGE